jgi:proton glutamate symport protein
VTKEGTNHRRDYLPVDVKNGILMTALPDIRQRGIGIEIRPVTDVISGKKDRTAKNVLREVFTGLIPENIFQSMSHGDILPLIIVSIFFAIALSSLGKSGLPAIAFINACNNAIMKLDDNE